MRKLYLVLMVLGLLLAGFTVAQAANPLAGNPFNVQGTITAITLNPNTLTVKTLDGEVFLSTTENTVVVIDQVISTFDQLSYGDYVKVQTIEAVAIKICKPIKQIIE